MLDALLRKPDRSILLLPQHLIGALKLTQLIGIPDIWKLFGSERKRKAIQPSTGLKDKAGNSVWSEDLAQIEGHTQVIEPFKGSRRLGIPKFRNLVTRPQKE